jgi:hypothetical protein
MAQRGATPPQMRIVIMQNKTLEDTIASLMVFYADYRDACQECVDLNDRYGTEEYESAVERRSRCASYIREDIDALKALGIKFDRFEYIGQ